MTSKVECGNRVRASRGINNLKKLQWMSSRDDMEIVRGARFKRGGGGGCDGGLAAYCPGPDAPRRGAPWACVFSIREWNRSRSGPINTSDSPCRI